jgi:hypothetical protein
LADLGGGHTNMITREFRHIGQSASYFLVFYVIS